MKTQIIKIIIRLLIFICKGWPIHEIEIEEVYGKKNGILKKIYSKLFLNRILIN